jgi:hypothetical protein
MRKTLRNEKKVDQLPHGGTTGCLSPVVPKIDCIRGDLNPRS